MKKKYSNETAQPVFVLTFPFLALFGTYLHNLRQYAFKCLSIILAIQILFNASQVVFKNCTSFCKDLMLLGLSYKGWCFQLQGQMNSHSLCLINYLKISSSFIFFIVRNSQVGEDYINTSRSNCFYFSCIAFL